ncbi:DNA cytosine methyltransferase [Ruminococcaceae bacterium OttesenSCG-928-I18]|nr:DNA cytosine methyltransferase [Ruminococcaceae bacterium OttesenSCG-928-I18]
MHNNNQITLGSLFDGIGGFPYAGLFYGIRPLWASEILPQAVSVTTRHLPWMQHVGDITTLDGAKLPPVDIITFGSPCQGLSTAGRRLGLADERSALFTDAIRIIDEMREATNGQYPRFALWENVPGALSSAGGGDFKAVLEAFAKTEVPIPRSGRWANAGMVRSGGTDIAWRVLNAQHFGVPQRRRRIFLVCDFTGGRAGEVLFVEESLRGYPSPGGETRQGTTADAQRCADGAVPPRCLTPWDTQQSRVFTGDGASPTLAGADGGGGRNPAGLVFTAGFCAGASDQVKGIGYTEETAPTLKSGGFQMPTVFCAASSQTNAGITEELAGTLTCQHEQPFICEPETARTLTARGDGSPCADRGPNIVAMETPAVTMRLREGCEGGGKGPLLQTEISGTLATGNDQYLFTPCAVGVHQNQDGNITTSDAAYSLATTGNASSCNAPLVACGFDLQQITSKENRSSLKEVQPTLCAGGNPHVVAGLVTKGDGDVYLTPERHAALSCGGGQAGQGYPAVLEELDSRVAYAMQGNMIGREDHNGPEGIGVSENLSFTLTTRDTPAIAAHEPIPIHDRATRHKGGGPTRNGDGSGNGLGIGKPGDPAPTMTAGDHHAVAAVDCRNFNEVGDLSGTLQAKDKPGYSLNYQNPVRTGYIVRRLTPIECERLQGFPDGWTALGHDGKEISDTRRYQMLGNSVAVPCVGYILRGIAAQMDEAKCLEEA